MAIAPKGKATNSMPSWVTAPAPGSMNTMATQQLTNPVTGETWMANSGGYSVKPTWDGDSFSQHSGKSYTVDPNNPNNYIGTFRNDYALQPGDNGYIGTGRDLLPPEPGTPGASGVWGNSTSGAQGTGGKGVGNVVNAQPTNSVEPVWADNFNWNTATLADAHRKLSTDKYGMVNYARYSDADAQRLLDSERSSMASTQQPAPQATGGMGAINPSVFPAIANGMFGNANTGGTATSSFGWQNAQPSQGTGGKGVGNVVNAQPIQSAASLLQPYYNAQQAPTLMSATSGNRAGQPYVYGDLGLTSSDYSIWGSKGNPYAYGPGYNPGTRYAPTIIPQPIAPIAPPSNGGDSDYPTAPGTGGDSGLGDQPWANRKVLGNLYPGLGLAYGLVDGRIDNPYGEGYARLPWYEGSAGGGYGYTEEGYDQYAPGDSDRGIYSNYYDANGNLVSERSWDDGFDDYNTNDSWADTGFFEGMGNIFGGRTWDGAEGPTVFGQEAPVASTPRTFGDPNSALAQQATKAIAADKQRVATNIQNIADAKEAEQQAVRMEQAAFRNELTTTQTALMNDIAADMRAQYGDFSNRVDGQLEQMAAENASMFDSFEEYQDWNADNGDGTSTAGGYTWDSDLGTFTEMQEETGLGTAEWDTSHSDFSWGDSSDAGDGTTDASDDPGGDDDDAGGWSFSDDDSGGGDSGGGGGGGSYIATAATNALGEGGLKLFEDWRDYMFTALPTFTTSYGRYRVTAPKIVSAIDKKDNSKELYQDIWNEYLKPIFGLIKKDMNNPKALSDYKVMVKELTNKYLKGDK